MATPIDECNHEALLSEIPVILRMPISERLSLAHQRRVNQKMRYDRWIQQQPQQQLRSSDGEAGTSRGQKDRRGRRGSVRFDGRSRLLEAARNRDLEGVRTVLKSDPSTVNTWLTTNGLTSLHQAAVENNLELARVLVEFGADVNCADAENWTPLHSAALYGQPQIAQFLIDRGAELLVLNQAGHMPYDLCDDETTLDIIESAMAKEGVTQEMINEIRGAEEKAALRDLRRLSQEGGDLEFKGQQGETPLHVAACCGHLEIAEYLLSRMVSLDAVDDELWQPIHCAAYWRQTGMVELLVRHGADLNSKTIDGLTPCDLGPDDETRHWLLEMRSMQEACKLVHNSTVASKQLSTVSNDLLSGPQKSPTADGSHVSLYSSNLSLGDKSALSSSVKRLNSQLQDTTGSRKKDAGDGVELWSSMQSLAEESSETDSELQRLPMSSEEKQRQHQLRLAAEPPSIDDQLQSIADEFIANSIRVKTASPMTVALRSADADNPPMTTVAAQQRPNGSTRPSDDPPSDCDDPADTNWQLKKHAGQPPDASEAAEGRYRTTDDGGGPEGVEIATPSTANGRAFATPDPSASTAAARTVSTRGQTSAEMKRLRAEQRRSGGAATATADHDGVNGVESRSTNGTALAADRNGSSASERSKNSWTQQSAPSGGDGRSSVDKRETEDKFRRRCCVLL